MRFLNEIQVFVPSALCFYPNINSILCLMNQLLINSKYFIIFICKADPRMKATEHIKNCLFNSTQKIISYFMIRFFRGGRHYLHKFNKYLFFVCLKIVH